MDSHSAAILAAYKGRGAMSEALATAITAAAVRLGAHPFDLANVINFESGFRPDIENVGCVKDHGKRSGKCAVGLIQFIPSTAKRLGTDTGKLAGMNALDQLRYVEDYFRKAAAGRSLATPQAVFMAVFQPAAIGKPSSYTFSREVQKANPGIKTVGDYVAMATRAAKLPSSDKLGGWTPAPATPLSPPPTAPRSPNMATLYIDNWSATTAKGLKDGGLRTAPAPGVVIHYSTGTKGTVENVVEELQKSGLSYNFIVGRNPVQVVMLRAPEVKTWHAGGNIPATGAGTAYPSARKPRSTQLPVGAPGKLPNGKSPNTNTVGVSFLSGWAWTNSEAVAKRDPYSVKSSWPYPGRTDGTKGWWEGYPPDQIDLGARLVAWLLVNAGQKAASLSGLIFPHGDHPDAAGIANWKPDPGPGFPWKSFLALVDKYRQEGVEVVFDKPALDKPRILPRP